MAEVAEERKQFPIRLPNEVVVDLEMFADLRGVSRNALIAIALYEWVQQEKLKIAVKDNISSNS